METKREKMRARYIDGWNTMNPDLLMSTTVTDFIFDDPADPAPITKQELVAYMPIWPERAAALGGTFDFHMVDKVVKDMDGILHEWYYWTLIGTGVEGSAQIKTCDEGVMLERITYFKTPWPMLR